MAMEDETLDQDGSEDGEAGESLQSEAKEPATRKLWDWLEGYCEFTQDFEPPAVFNKWCGLVALACATGRKVWLEEANTRIYPNLFVVLVASSGVGKTTAMREVLPFIEESGIALSAGKPSAAKLLTSISEAQTFDAQLGALTSYLIYAEELPSFLGTDAYKSGMIADLTTLYDCPDHWTKETHIRQVEEINNAFVCTLAGTTAEGLFDVMPSGAVTQGFTARILFIHAYYNEKRVVEKPWGPRQQKLFDPLKHDIKRIAALRGPAKFSDIAKVYWVDYYMSRAHPADEFTDTRLQGYAARKPFYVKKLALLLALSEGDALVVEATHLERAQQLLKEVDRTLGQVYEDIAPSVAMKSYGKIIGKLQRAGGRLRKSDLMRAYAYVMDGVDFEKAMSYLGGMGLVEVELEASRSGRPTTIYRLTQAGREWKR